MKYSIFIALGLTIACEPDSAGSAVPGHLRDAACVLESLPPGSLEVIAAIESHEGKLAALAKLIPAIQQCYPDGQ